ncbi:hypothetical protein KXD97_06375 [Mycobacterium sp. SMC-8]|nr:hypothetical protein KXD97_06375 [Mycobacterium sp. SMC-8]
MVAAGAAGWLWTSSVAQTQPQPTPRQPAVSTPAPQQIHRAGQVIAVTKDSLTTSTPDGQTTTFRITADTHQIGRPSTLKRHVVVLGVVHDGVAVATAIADQGAVGPDGPPMDYGLPT